MSDEKEQIYNYLYDVVGEAGCGVTCSEAEIFFENGEWKLFLEGFMEPWPIGKNLEDAKLNIKEYASQGFGLS